MALFIVVKPEASLEDETLVESLTLLTSVAQILTQKPEDLHIHPVYGLLSLFCWNLVDDSMNNAPKYQ